jgi:PAS domain S-box-containing protein
MASDLLIRLPDYFPSLIDAMQDGFVLRSIDGTIVDANDAFLKLVGRSRSEVIGARPPHPWWPQPHHDRDAITEAHSRYIRGDASEDRLTYQRADGTEFPVVVTSAPVRDRDDQIIGFIGTVKDMTLWSRVEQQMQFQARLIDEAGAAVVALDRDGRVTLWSAGAQLLLGYEHQEAVGHLFLDLVEPPSEHRIADLLHTAEREGTTERELVLKRRDGSTLVSLMSASAIEDDAGDLIGFVTVAVDVSQRNRAEAQLQVQFDVARVLADANSLSAGLQDALRTIGETIGWPIGTIWMPDRRADVLRCRDVWHAFGTDSAEFDRASHDTPLGRGEGLPGRVWQLGAPAWIGSLAEDTLFPRKDAVLRAGMQSAIAFPIESERKILGVVEFFFPEVREPDPDLTNILMALGRQIGQFIDRRRAIGALRESEDRFRSMADGAPVLLWVADTAGLMTYVNRGWLTFTGRTVEQEAGNGWAKGVHPDDLARYLDTRATALATREPYETEYRLRRHDGAYRWLLDTGSPRFEQDGTFAGFIGSCVDIHDRKQAEQDQMFLSEATRILASSLDYHTTLTSVAQLAVPAVADWCVIHMVDEHQIPQQEALAHVAPEKVAWAQALQSDYPIDMESPTGLPWVLRTAQPLILPVITDEQLQEVAIDARHLEVLRSVGFTSAMIVPIVARGRALGAISFVSAEQGRQYGDADLVLAQHLARRAAVAIDNARLYREAQDASHARDQFLAVAAHELRSPLTSMKGFAQLLLRRASRTDSQEEWIRPLQTIDSQINRVTDLVNRLLDVSRIQEKRLQIQTARDDLLEIINVAVNEAQMATEQHVITYVGSHEPMLADVDRTRIAQVLSNLLGNAIRYSPGGTPVTVDAQSNDEEIVVSVSDKGPGLPPDSRERLFDRYFRGDGALNSTAEGLGLGLYVAHGIVLAHGGRMWVQSEPGHGATFFFAIPRNQPAGESQ